MTRTVSCGRVHSAVTVVLLLACVCSLSHGFALRGWAATGASTRGLPGQRGAARRDVTRGVLAARAQLDAVEAKAVQRFTKSYDKLCKTCPTRLQPRVDTLEEMIVGLPEDELKLLAAKVALRLSGHDAAALAGISPGGAVADSGGVAVAMPLEKMGGEGGDLGRMEPKKQMPEVNKAEMEMKKAEMEMGKAEKKRAKLQRKIKEREMDMSMYQAEMKFLQYLEESDDKMSPERVVDQFLEVPVSCEADRKEMEMKVSKRCMEAAGMTGVKREIRSLKVQEKMFKCKRKMKECSAELSMMADPVHC